MFLVLKQNFCRPIDFPDEGCFAEYTIVHSTNAAVRRNTGVGMDKQFDMVLPVFVQDIFQLFYLLVHLVKWVKERKCHMAIHVQVIPEFLKPKIVYVYPGGFTVLRCIARLSSSYLSS